MDMGHCQSVAVHSVDAGAGMAIFMGWDDDGAVSEADVAGVRVEAGAVSENDMATVRSEGSARVCFLSALVAFACVT